MTKKLWVDYDSNTNLPRATTGCRVTAMRKRLKCGIDDTATHKSLPYNLLLWVIPTDRYDSVVAALTLYGVNTEVYDD